MRAEKQAVRAAFSRAAPHYDGVAEVQRRIARHLLSLTPSAQRILDAGCGTGFGARLLREAQPAAQIHALDAAHAMCVHSGEALAACGDIEALPLANASLDLYWSSLAWQWTRPTLAAAEAARVLSPGGCLCVASLGAGTLHELRQAFAGVDAYPHVRQFHDAATHVAALHAAGFQEISLTQACEQVFANDLRGLLRDIRSLGAHELGQTRRPGLLSRQAWLRLQAAYETYRNEAGLPVTYDVIYLYARKP